MKQILKYLIWAGILQLAAVSTGLVILAMDLRWRSKLDKTASTLQKGDVTLDTLTTKMVASRELEECKQRGRAISEFGKSASISLKADNAATRSFTQATDAALWIVIGSGFISLCLVARIIIPIRKDFGALRD